MEQLLHYCWQHKIFPLHPLETVDHQPLEVIHPGLHNQDAGPDFFNAKIRIDGQLWVGNVEIHDRASDWFLHHHDLDSAYDNVILHVVGINDRRIFRRNMPKLVVPQLQLEIPSYVQKNYQTLLADEKSPRCAHVLSTLPSLLIHNWMSALLIERLEERTHQVEERRTHFDGDWETTCFVTLARHFGFGINGDAMEHWAASIPLRQLGKVRDEPFAIESIFLGQAGLLQPSSRTLQLLQKNHRSPADYPYFQQLQHEYNYQQHKFNLTPINPTLWRMARLRPQNFPQIRLSQLANLYCAGHLNLSTLLSAKSLQDCRNLLSTGVTKFWRTHYGLFADETTPSDKQVSTASKDLLITNAVTTLLFAYGRYKGDETLCERAIGWLEQLPAEHNRIIAEWDDVGITSDSAADTQALIQLTRAYCEPHDCLRCRFGYEFMHCTPDFLREDPS